MQPQNKQKVTKVMNVYQEKYANDEYCTGLGDYIRGSLCLLQYATMQNLDFDMHYASHPISAFLCKMKTVKKEEVDATAMIHPFRVYNYKTNNEPNNTLKKIQKDFTTVINHKLGGFQADSTTYTMYTIAFPVQPVKREHKTRVRNALLPTPELQTKIDKYMLGCKIQPKKYTVIHVRTGDKYLLNNPVPSIRVAIECKRAFLEVLDKDVFSEPCVLISDSAELKKQLKNVFPKFIINHHSITHMGENALTNANAHAVENTLVDFFLMANAGAVHAFSALDHGTGFSEQCCQLYNVDYSSHYLPI